MAEPFLLIDLTVEYAARWVPVPGRPLLRTHLMHLLRKLGDDAENQNYIFAEPRVGAGGRGASSQASPGTEATGAYGGG